MVRAQPRLIPVHFVLARALFQSGRIDDAQKEFEALAAAQPNGAEIQTWLGQVYLAKANRAKARDAFERAIKLDPGSFLAFNGLVTLDVLDKNNEAARGRLEARLASTKPNTELLLLAGNSFMLLDDVTRAEALFRQLLAIDPNNIDAYAKLGAIHVQKGDLAGAERQYQDAAKRQRKPVAAMTFLGIIAELQKRPDAAKKYYEQALSIDDHAAVASNNLAWILADRGEDLDHALQLAQTAKAALPHHASVSNTLGWVFYKKGLMSQAVTALRESVEQSPKDPSKQYYLGLAYLKNNQQIEARTAFERALKLNPQFAQAADARQALASIKS